MALDVDLLRKTITKLGNDLTTGDEHAGCLCTSPGKWRLIVRGFYLDAGTNNKRDIDVPAAGMSVVARMTDYEQSAVADFVLKCCTTHHFKMSRSYQYRSDCGLTYYLSPDWDFFTLD